MNNIVIVSKGSEFKGKKGEGKGIKRQKRIKQREQKVSKSLQVDATLKLKNCANSSSKIANELGSEPPNETNNFNNSQPKIWLKNYMTYSHL